MGDYLSLPKSIATKNWEKRTKNRSFLAENGATPILANPSHLAYSWRILLFLIVISTLFATRNFTVVIDFVNTIDFLGTLPITTINNLKSLNGALGTADQMLTVYLVC